MTLGLGLKQRPLCNLAQARSSQTADEWSLGGNVDPRSALPFLGLCNDSVRAKGGLKKMCHDGEEVSKAPRVQTQRAPWPPGTALPWPHPVPSLAA